MIEIALVSLLFVEAHFDAQYASFYIFPDRLQITCATQDGNDSDSRIDAVGGPIGTDTWVMPIEDAITRIERDGWTFWTQVDGQTAEVRLHERGGNKFLQTEGDNTETNNLKKLENCPDVDYSPLSLSLSS